MNPPENILEIFLQPGDFYWGDHETRIRTILGSCVSLVLWHPIKRIGGMCHIMLPSRGTKRKANEPLDGKYGDEAWELFMIELEKSRTKPFEYVTKLFGGATMFTDSEKTLNEIKSGSITKMNMGQRNIEMIREVIKLNNLNLISENTGGNSSRRIHFDLWSGNVWLKRHQLVSPIYNV